MKTGKESIQEPVKEKSIMAGNMVTGSINQPLLNVGEPGDANEKQADAVAGKLAHKAENNFLQTKSNDGNISPGMQTGAETGSKETGISSETFASSKGNGQGMDSHTQSFMENYFGTDFSSVKIHTGNDAARMNRDLNAKAFTYGKDIYFNEGEYRPSTKEGLELLAHELTHTLQQGGNRVIQRKPKKPAYVEGGGATPGTGEGVDIVFIIHSPGDEFTSDVVKYIQNTLIGQEYYVVEGLDDLFAQLDRIATGFEYHYVPIIEEMKLPPEMERIRDIVVAPRKVRRIRLVAHGQTVIGGVSMRAPGAKEKTFIPPADIVAYSKQPHIQEIVKKAMTPDAVVEFWGCNIGAVPEAGKAWSDLFQSKFKATGETFKTGFNEFYRRPDKGEEGEDVDGLKGKVVKVTNSSEVYSRGKALQASFKTWLLKRYAELVINGDILPIKSKKDQLIFMEELFNRSNGNIKYIQVERKDDEKLFRPGAGKEWKKLWKEFSPVKIGVTP